MQTFVVKYDYITQHIPFYQEFYRLLNEGLPLWSWNGFLGLNFYASKIYYLMGDLDAWISVLIHSLNQDIPKTLSILLILKFVVSYTVFFRLTQYWKINPIFMMVLSLFYVFSGWNLMFLEQVMFTSFYSFIPLLFIGLEHYFKTQKSYILILSVALLVSTNFYLFWMISWLFLLYFIFRFLELNEFKLRIFIQVSIKLLLAFILGVGLVSFIWLPGVLHLLESSRNTGLLNTFESWSSLQMNSFLAFTLIPNLRYENGIFKDFYYYFNQVSFYVSLLLILMIHQLFSKGIDKKLKRLTILYLTFFVLLLISPKIGLFFNFSYSLRYTYIHTFFMLYFGALSLKNIDHWTIKTAIISEILLISIFVYLLSYAIPKNYTDLSILTIEIDLLKIGLLLSIAYTFLIILHILRKQKRDQSLWMYLMVGLAIVELSTFSYQNFKSIQGEGLIYAEDQDFINAQNHIKEIDTDFYRIYTNAQPTYENLSYSYDFRSIVTHDTMYQYSLQEFLHITRQYPYIHWGFNLHDFSILQLIGVKYEIVLNDQATYPSGLYMATKLDVSFGPYSIYRYEYETGFTRTYTSYKNTKTLLKTNIEEEDYYVSDVMDKLNQDVYLDLDSIDLSSLSNTASDTHYFEADLLKNNYVEMNILLDQSSIIVLNMPYDKGWTIRDNETKINTFPVQGGFLGILLEPGTHSLTLKFIPDGLISGLSISFVSLILTILYVFKHKLIKQ